MHRITKFDLSTQYIEYVDPTIITIMKAKVDKYNELFKIYHEGYTSITNTDTDEKKKLDEQLKRLYLEILYSNPAGFQLTARLTTNYRCLKNIYLQRKNHRLPEWREFCKWIETLPYFNELIKPSHLEE